MEIELKFLIEPNKLDDFFALIQATPFQVEPQPARQLANAYFDTQDNTLRQWDFGLRTRTSLDDAGQGWSEQTVKLAGQDIGGLHQRPEYTVKFDHSDSVFADLTLFDNTIWPSGFEPTKVQPNIVKVFETLFKRHIWLITTPSGSQIECVLDTGAVEANGKQVEICEIELELVTGDVADIFLIGQYFTNQLPLKLGTLSKAARGYMLAADKQMACTELKLMEFDADTSIEHSFVQSLSAAVKFIQHHEVVFSQTDSAKALRRIIDGISFLIRILSLYAPSLPGSQCEYFIEAFKALRRNNHWVHLFYQFEQLTSRQSPYRKDIKKSDYLLNLLSEHQLPEEKIELAKQQFVNSDFNALMLKFLFWLSQKSWRCEMQLTDLSNLSQPLGLKSNAWLDTAWDNLRKQIKRFAKEKTQGLPEQVYPLLTKELLTGLCVGNLYNQEEWQAFRGSLLDFMVGLEELMLLRALENLLSEQTHEEAKEHQNWLSAKQQSLLTALKVSASHVVKLKPYW